VRFLIGFAESGFFPGAVLFFSYWVPASHRGRVMAMFMSALAISGVIGGPICGTIMGYLHGVSGLAGWQWLMIATGVPCVAVAVAIAAILTDRPEQSHWLDRHDRQLLLHHLGGDAGAATPKTALRAALTHFWSWNGALIYFLLVCGGYGLSFWMPTVLQRAGVESPVHIGFLVALPNLIGVVAMTLLGRHSDKRGERRWHLTACMGLSAIGYAIVATQLDNLGGLLVGLSMAHIGVLSALPISWTVHTRMLPPAAAAVGIAIITSIGNLGGFVSPVLVGKISVMTGSMAGGFWIIASALLIGGAWVAITVKLPRD
jgi:MFS family permease